MIIDKAYVGSSEVDKIYLGAELVWQALEPGIPVEGAPNGVYILHTNKTLYTREQWNTSHNKDAVGVALVSDNCKFVIAPEQSYRLMWSKGGAEEIVSGVTIITGASTTNDYNGVQNSAAIVSKYGSSTDYAAGYCQNYTFKNGYKGYLGSLGEWQESYNNKEEIDACMSLIGGTDITTNIFYWTSTQFSSSMAWMTSFSNGYVGTELKNSDYLARAFAPLT